MTTQTTNSHCAGCGMRITAREYHPHAACLMFKSCRNSEEVRTNLQAVLDRGEEIANAKREI